MLRRDQESRLERQARRTVEEDTFPGEVAAAAADMPQDQRTVVVLLEDTLAQDRRLQEEPDRQHNRADRRPRHSTRMLALVHNPRALSHLVDDTVVDCMEGYTL